MNKIRENLWVTDIATIREEPFDADAVVTVCQESVYDNVPTECYARFNMADGPHNAYGGDASYGLFEAAAMAVVSLVGAGRKTVVHCHHGQSRSTAVCMAALGLGEGVTYEEAFDMVADARPRTDPDPTLREHAKTFIDSHR